MWSLFDAHVLMKRGGTADFMTIKYDAEFRERTCKHIKESGKSATSVGEELGIDKNTVCTWMRHYRKSNHLPSHAEELGGKHTAKVQRKTEDKQSQKDKRRIMELEERVEILKKALHIFMQAPQ